jgi:hypothetical protein
MSGGIPGDIYSLMVRVLPDSSVFDSNRDVRAFFARESLKPWRNSVPEYHNSRGRASAVLAFLHDKGRARGRSDKWFDGMNALKIFLTELFLYYQVEGQELATPELLELFGILSQRDFLVECGDFVQLGSGPHAVVFCKWCGTPYRFLPNPAKCDSCGGGIV